MKFKQIKKHPNYKEWVWNDSRSSCIVHINMMPKTKIIEAFYHYKIICSEKYCKKSECEQKECLYKLDYSSLNDGLKYESLEECQDGVTVWFYKHKDDLFCPLW
jgi:hypothetical protein